ncbi:TPA: hypothetical protein KO123_002320 [Clostridioides difficile]|nr:hypothetical protein [Clostridioides difficile]
MRFWCESCNKYFDVEETLQKYNYFLNEEIIICPTCKRDLIPIARKTELSLGFNYDRNKLNYVEYDSSDYSILRTVNTDIEDIVKPIISYMKSLNKNNLNLNGITITMNGNREGKRLDGLNYEEGVVMDNLINAWNGFYKLKKQHPSELNDFQNAIHQAQQVLGLRVLRNDYPEGWIKK